MKYLLILLCLAIFQPSFAVVLEKKAINNCSSILANGKLVFSDPIVLREDLLELVFHESSETLGKDAKKAFSVYASTQNEDEAQLDLRVLPRIDRHGLTINMGGGDFIQLGIDTTEDSQRGTLRSVVIDGILLNAALQGAGYLEFPMGSQLKFAVDETGNAWISILNFEGQDEVFILMAEGRTLTPWQLKLESFFQWLMKRDEPFMIRRK